MLRILTFLLLSAAATARAEHMVYVGDGGQKLTMEKSTEIKHDTYVVKLEGVDSPWAGKPILVTVKPKRGQDDRYTFKYEKKDSSGKTEYGTYEMILPGDPTLVNGTITKTMGVYYKGSKDALELTYDKAATQAVKDGALTAEYKKNPYTPVP